MKRLFVVTCFTLAQLKNVECRSFCRYYAGYDSGLYVEESNKCYCQDEVEAEQLQEKRLILPKKVKEENYEYNPADTPVSEPEPEVVTIPYKLPWE